MASNMTSTSRSRAVQVLVVAAVVLVGCFALLPGAGASTAGAARPLAPQATISIMSFRYQQLGRQILHKLGELKERPLSVARASKIVADEFTRRNAETMTTMNTLIQTHPKEWSDLSAKVPAS